MFSIENPQNRYQKESWQKWSTQVQKLTQATGVGPIREIIQPPKAWQKLSKIPTGVDHFRQSIRHRAARRVSVFDLLCLGLEFWGFTGMLRF